MAYYFPSSTTSSSTIVNMSAGDYVYVAPNVDLIGTGGDGEPIYDGSYGTAQIDGALVGAYTVYFNGATGQTTTIDISSTATIAGYGGYTALVAYIGTHYISNSGAISSSQGGDGVALEGPGVFLNYGSITASGDGIVNFDSTATDVASVYNYGSISSGSYGIDDYDGHIANIYNYGTINGVTAAIDIYVDTVGHLYNYGTLDGAVDLGNGGSYFVNSGSVLGAIGLGGAAGEYVDSTDGSVSGAIVCGGGGDVVIAGQTGGTVLGGAGNDVLYANPTQTAANNAAKTTLDGGTGNNWLYGDGAYTTFDSGDNSAGTYNQIFGGQSEMAGVSGYTNNTVDYASLSSAYKSVDINLLNGDAYMCSIADANGAPAADLTFEDYLKNVPNVIGSSGSDVIICDDGVDRITHGSGAGDILYAGTGAGSQDTFVYTAINESPLSNHDIIEGFKVGIDKLDFSQLDLPIADFLLSSGGSGSNTVYVEKNPSTGFNSATDMIVSVQASTSAALTYKDIIT
jgi:hypothetical protein